MNDPSQQILDVLSRARRVLITTHVRPDGDALGSTAAMVMGLKQKGIESKVLLLSHLPRKYAFVYEENAIPFIDVESGWPADFSLDDYDALLVIDTGTWSQLPGLRERIEKWPKPKLVIDHHLTQENWADVKLVDTAAGAAGEVVEELLMKWGVTLDKKISTALFLAIVADTGWFMYSNTRPQTLRLAARLMDEGVNTDAIYQRLKQSERPERILLHTRGYQSLELLADGKLAVMTVRKQDFAETRSHVNDTEDMINFPLQIRSVEVSVLFVEPPDESGIGSRVSGIGSDKESGPASDDRSSALTRTPKPEPRNPIRISFRSKGHLDVAAFAQQFGGGGHARASGAKIENVSLEEAKRRVVAALGAEMTK